MIRVENLVRKNINREHVTLIHGTSVEAACALLQKGRLVIEPFSDRLDRGYPGYLFFSVHGIYFRDHPLTKQGLNPGTWERAVEASQSYAQQNAQEHYIVSQIGYYSKYLADLPLARSKKFPEVEFAPQIDALFDFIEELKVTKGYSSKEVWRLCEQASVRKGVLLTCGVNALELKLEPPKEAIEEVCIDLPQGLDIQYINGIIPLGEIEREVLSSL